MPHHIVPIFVFLPTILFPLRHFSPSPFFLFTSAGDVQRGFFVPVQQQRSSARQQRAWGGGAGSGKRLTARARLSPAVCEENALGRGCETSQGCRKSDSQAAPPLLSAPARRDKRQGTPPRPRPPRSPQTTFQGAFQIVLKSLNLFYFESAHSLFPV